MPAPVKPRHRSGYTAEQTEQVKTVCVTVDVTLGAYLDDVCIVGGLLPPPLIDERRSRRDGYTYTALAPQYQTTP
jgi:hypothetical protein